MFLAVAAKTSNVCPLPSQMLVRFAPLPVAEPLLFSFRFVLPCLMVPKWRLRTVNFHCHSLDVGQKSVYRSCCWLLLLHFCPSVRGILYGKWKGIIFGHLQFGLELIIRCYFVTRHHSVAYRITSRWKCHLFGLTSVCVERAPVTQKEKKKVNALHLSVLQKGLKD